ncbi:hypothetical protein LguiA_012527 [Lonicera macranthoides]
MLESFKLWTNSFLNIPLLKDSDNEYSISISSWLSFSSSSSGHDHDDLPTLLLDSDKPSVNSASHTRNPNPNPPRVRVVTLRSVSSQNNPAASRGGRKIGLPRKSIFQVPNKLRKFNEDSYSPRVVSIGPIHRGKSELLAMEELKWSYIESFFYLKENPVMALEDACHKILGLEDKARKYYARDFRRLSKYQLAEILIIDVASYLKYLRKSGQLKLKFKNKGVNIKDDPILNNDLMIRMLQQDLALLENQIPFRPRLVHVFEHSGEESLSFPLFASLSIDESVSGEKKWGFKLKFEKASSDHLLDLVFDKKRGELQIPQLRVGGIASTLVRNLVAFEQCNFGTTRHMTAYVMLMRSLISSSEDEDVELLRRREILELELGSSEDVLSYFRNICAEIVPKDYYFDGLCRCVNKYEMSHWNLHQHGPSMKLWFHGTMATRLLPQSVQDHRMPEYPQMSGPSRALQESVFRSPERTGMRQDRE